ncbi:MAG TPA: DUF4191 domain-containing protein [Mycobacteriales bacterium]|jgi:hypothetical protein|nr:DUF4191 domain-containing protein [Mycobacteriales bacterium]
MATKADKPKSKFKDRFGQLKLAFSFTRKHDKLLVPILLAAFLIVAGLGILAAWLTGQWLLFTPLGVLLGILAIVILFGRRVAKATYSEVEGKPGAAAAIMENMRGNWRLTPAVAVTQQQDVAHRLIGRCGVVIVIEGSTTRLKSLIAQEKKRVSRVSPETPIYEVFVGNRENEVPLKKLQAHLVKLPRNITPKQVNSLEGRLSALGVRPPIPQGPLPKGAKTSRR